MSLQRKFLVAGAATSVILAAGLTQFAVRGKQVGQPRDGAAARERQRAAAMEQESGTPAVQGTEGMEGMPGMEMGGGTLRLTADQIRTFGITFGTAEVRRLTRTIRTVGFVEFDETRLAYVSPKFSGWVERLHGDFTWKPVRRGEPLAEVYSPELVTAQEELLLAATLADSVGESPVTDVARGAARLLEEAKRRLLYWDISDQQIDELLRTRQVRKTLTLHAPISGVVMEKKAVEGQAFFPGQHLYMIADLSEVWIQGEVFEADAALIRAGMPAVVTIAALPGRSFRGRVDYVYPTLEEKTRSMKVRIALANPTGQVKPGMYATVSFQMDLGDVLTVPGSAVLHTGTRDIAFVDMGGGTLMPHELTVGQRGGGYVQVLDGVEPGMRVVTSAQYLLDSESNLAEVMQAMMAQMNLSDMGGRDMPGMKVDMPESRMQGMEAMPMPGTRQDAPKDTSMDMPDMQNMPGMSEMKPPRGRKER